MGGEGSEVSHNGRRPRSSLSVLKWTQSLVEKGHMTSTPSTPTANHRLVPPFCLREEGASALYSKLPGRSQREGRSGPGWGPTTAILIGSNQETNPAARPLGYTHPHPTSTKEACNLQPCSKRAPFPSRDAAVGLCPILRGQEKTCQKDAVHR